MKDNNHFVAARTWVSRITVLAICAGFITACNDTKPDVVVVTPTTVASPTPTPIAPTPVVTPVPTTTATVAPTTAVSPTPAGTTTTTTRTVITDTEPITDVVVVSSAPDPQSLVGKRVKFTGTKVLSVIGDRPFWVGRSNNEQLVVVLDPSLDAGSAEDKIQIKAGQTRNITGVLKPMPSAATAQKQWGITAQEAQGLQTKGVYLQADKIQ